MNKTSIEWCSRPQTGGPSGAFTWNPIRARRLMEVPSDGDQVAAEYERIGTFCTRISPGCTHCYASTINKRFGTGAEYTVPELANHEFYIDERILQEPLKRKKPATIFVGDMFDLFHEAIPIQFVGRVFGMMAKCQQHTFQVLTKRAEGMQGVLSRAPQYDGGLTPLPNVWLGVSVENPDYKWRIDMLRETPAVIRYLSIEPQLADMGVLDLRGIHQVIIGGESGHGARPFDVRWVPPIFEQCKMAGAARFMKQLGSHPVCDGSDMRFPRNSKNGNPAEWPEVLRVREFPA